MIWLQKPLAIIKEHKKAFVACNLGFYGAVALGMLVAAFYPQLQEQYVKSVEEQFKGTAASDAYGNGKLIQAIVLTFLINLGIGTFLSVTLPSLIIPFAGILMALFRAVLWGFLFSPIRPDAVRLLPHWLTIVIEGQAYILAAFAAYVHGRAFLWPKRYGLKSRWAGYKSGLIDTAWLYVLIIITLIVGAIYEGIEVIYVVHR